MKKTNEKGAFMQLLGNPGLKVLLEVFLALQAIAPIISMLASVKTLFK